jgi:ABC-type Zn uptake system ZnuABC Zn-binding protein ZnuA
LPRLARVSGRLLGGLLGLGICMGLTATNALAKGIITTLPPLTGLVLLLDGEADVHCLLPPGADAHDFQLTPRQVQGLKSADLLIRSSYDDGHWSGIGAKRRSFDLWPTQAHAWLSPNAVRDRLPALAAELQALAPERSAQIAAALTRAIKACDAADADWRKALAPYRDAGAIMQHNAWAPVLQQYGVPVWSVLESGHHGDDIGPHRLEEALGLLHTHPGALLWGNQRHASRALQWLQEHAGNGARPRLLLFDPLGECGMTWPQLMQRNLDILKQAAGS